MAESAEQIREEIQNTKSRMISKLRTLEEKLSFGEQIHKHPWLSLGSAAALGYLSAHFRTGRSRKGSNQPATLMEPASRADNQETSVVGDTAIDVIPAAKQSSKWSLSSSIAQSTKAVVAQIVIEAAQRAVAQAVPVLLARSLHGTSHTTDHPSSERLEAEVDDADYLERTRGIS